VAPAVFDGAAKAPYVVSRRTTPSSVLVANAIAELDGKGDGFDTAESSEDEGGVGTEHKAVGTDTWCSPRHRSPLN